MFRLEKKPRLGSLAPAPTPTTLNHITGPAEVHTLLIRIALANNANEVMDMPDIAFTKDDVWELWCASWEVLYNGNHVNVAWVIHHELCEYVEGANNRLQWAKYTLFAEAAEEM